MTEVVLKYRGLNDLASFSGSRERLGTSDEIIFSSFECESTEHSLFFFFFSLVFGGSCVETHIFMWFLAEFQSPWYFNIISITAATAVSIVFNFFKFLSRCKIFSSQDAVFVYKYFPHILCDNEQQCFICTSKLIVYNFGFHMLCNCVLFCSRVCSREQGKPNGERETSLFLALGVGFADFNGYKLCIGWTLFSFK